jgi:hypothetical protein
MDTYPLPELPIEPDGQRWVLFSTASLVPNVDAKHFEVARFDGLSDDHSPGKVFEHFPRESIRLNGRAGSRVCRMPSDVLAQKLDSKLSSRAFKGLSDLTCLGS